MYWFCVDTTKQYTEEIDRIKEEQRKAEEKRKKEAKFLDDLQKRTEEEIQSRKASVAQTLEKVKAETEQLKDDKSKVRDVSEGGKWKEMFEFKEKQFEEELNDLRSKLKERERAWQKEKEKMLEDEKEREKEWNTERKKTQEREKKRNEEFERLNHELIDEKHSRTQTDEGFRKASDDLRYLSEHRIVFTTTTEKPRMLWKMNERNARLTTSAMLQESSSFKRISMTYKMITTSWRQIYERQKYSCEIPKMN